MHRVRQIMAVLAAVLMFAALPTAAVAQSSGDDQYTDPLAPNSGGGGSTGGGSGGGGSGGSGGGGGNAPAQPAQTQATPGQQATPAQADPNSLPRTGFPVALLVISGGVLLASGLALRRRTT
jgi:hypothetical protein